MAALEALKKKDNSPKSKFGRSDDIDWQTGQSMTNCGKDIMARKEKCNKKCGKIDATADRYSYSNKESKKCRDKAKNYPICYTRSACESQKTHSEAEALVKGIKKCDLKGVKKYKKCSKKCPNAYSVKSKLVGDEYVTFNVPYGADPCYEKNKECDYTKSTDWTIQRREIPCKKWEPGGGEYEKSQINALKDCAEKSWTKKDGGLTDKQFVKKKADVKYASKVKYNKKKADEYDWLKSYNHQQKCQDKKIPNDLCKGTIITKGFPSKYGVKCEVDKDKAYAKNPKECLKCGGRRSKHKRTNKKRRRKNKTKRKRTKRHRTKRKRERKRRRTKRR